MPPLEDRHALITGGGSGIGAACARALAAAGAVLSLAGRRAGPLQALVQELPRATAIATDITSEGEIAAMTAAARARHGAIDILIAAAGAAESAPATRIDSAHFSRMIAVNLTGAFLSARAVLPDLLRPAAPLPRIVFIASTAGLKGYAYAAAYCAAKHGVVGLARALAVELAPRGVTVNAVCPGYTDTPLLKTALDNIVEKTGLSRSRAEEELLRGNPQGRFVRPQEVAQTVLWLCTPGAQALTGQAIPVAGGEV